MTTITLQGTNAVQLQNPFGQGYTLQNTGPGVVYLDNDSSVSPGNGWALQVGVAQPVNAGTVLWACTEAGKIAVVQTLAGAQANSATVIEVTGPVDIGEVTLAPGSTVGITGTVNVAGSVNVTNASIPVTGSVNANITNASIALDPGTTVDINAGTVDIGNYVPSDVSAVVAGSLPVSYPTGITGPKGNSAAYTPPKNTVTGICKIQWPSAPPFLTLSDGNYVTIVISQYSGGILVDGFRAQWLINSESGSSTDPISLVTFPLRGETLNVDVEAQVTTAYTSTITITAQVSFTGSPVQQVEYTNFLTGGSYGVWNQSSPTNTSIGTYISSKSGPATLSTVPNNSTDRVNLDIQACLLGNARFFIASGNTITTGAPNTVVTQFPFVPLYAIGGFTAGGGSASVVQP